MRLSHAGGACLYAFVVVLFTGGETWTDVSVEKNRWIVLLYPDPKTEKKAQEGVGVLAPLMIPCVLLTRHYVLCQGRHVKLIKSWPVRTVLGEPDVLLGDVRSDPNDAYRSNQKTKLIKIEEKNQIIVNEFEEDFIILLGELEHPFVENERLGIVPLLLVRSWPLDFHVKALFVGYRRMLYGYLAGHATHNLISPVKCYARLSRWSVACVTDDEKRELCWEFVNSTYYHAGSDTLIQTTTLDSPEAIILVQGALYGFHNQYWDRFAWRCGNDTNPYFYGFPMLSINSIIPWIQETICSEAVVLLPLDLPSMENFSSGVNPHMRGTGSTFMSELYGTHECCNCGSVYTATQFLLLLAICFFSSSIQCSPALLH